jgi:hypothetical protein
MVAPYKGAPSPLGAFVGPYNAPWLWLECYKCGCRFAVPRAPYVIRYGPDAPATIITKTTRCLCCGQRTLSSMTPNHVRDLPTGEHAPFPVEHGYSAVRARYEGAKIDPVYLPAPMRGCLKQKPTH